MGLKFRYLQFYYYFCSVIFFGVSCFFIISSIAVRITTWSKSELSHSPLERTISADYHIGDCGLW